MLPNEGMHLFSKITFVYTYTCTYLLYLVGYRCLPYLPTGQKVCESHLFGENYLISYHCTHKVNVFERDEADVHLTFMSFFFGGGAKDMLAPLLRFWEGPWPDCPPPPPGSASEIRQSSTRHAFLFVPHRTHTNDYQYNTIQHIIHGCAGHLPVSIFSLRQPKRILVNATRDRKVPMCYHACPWLLK